MNIDTIFEHAKKMLLQDGEHYPMILAEFDGEVDICQIIGFGSRSGTSAERQQQLRQVGRMLGQRHRSKLLRAVALISEVWFAAQRGTQQDYPYSGPSQDPNRREGLMVLFFDLKTGKETVHFAEILRHGETLDLLPRPEGTPTEDKLLPAFAQGVAVGKYEKLAKKR